MVRPHSLGRHRDVVCCLSPTRGHRPSTHHGMELAVICALGLLLLLVAGCAPGRNLAMLPNQHAAPAAYRARQRGRHPHHYLRRRSVDRGVPGQRLAGTIAVPLLGQIPVAGLSVEQVAKTIETRLEQGKIFKNPSVSAEVTSYRPIFILGEVNRPGQYAYQPGMTLLSAVSVAGAASPTVPSRPTPRSFATWTATSSKARSTGRRSSSRAT